MYAIFRIVFTIALISAMFTAIGLFIPVSITTNINSSITYFLGFINNLNPIIPADVVFNCIKLLSNTILGVATFYIFRWLVHLLAG